MRATRPAVSIPGDNERSIIYIGPVSRREVRPFIMARAGECIGVSEFSAVWRFGFAPNSEAGEAYGVSVPPGRGPFFWYLTRRETGKIIYTFEGAAVDLPEHFRSVLEWKPRNY